MFIPVGVLAQRTVLGTQTVCGDNSASGGVVLVLLFVVSIQELCVDAVTNCGPCRFSHYFTPSRAVGVDALPYPDGQVACGGRQHSSPSRIELLSWTRAVLVIFRCVGEFMEAWRYPLLTYSLELRWES